MNSLSAMLAMIRFSHTLFALPFAILSAIWAWATPFPNQQAVPFRWQQVVGILCCMVFARSAAMAFNRLVDRHIDAVNPRTATRHLPAGTLKVKSVFWFTCCNSVGFIASCFWFWPNPWPVYLCIPVLMFLLGYSYAKRFTAWSHYWLGAALWLAPLCAWIAIRGQVLWENPTDLLPAAALGLAVFLWVGGFDVIYACQDVDFDRNHNLRSLPVRWGVVGALRGAALSHILMLITLAALPFAFPQLGLHWIYLSGLVLVAVLIGFEHFLVRPDDLSRVNLAFFHVNVVISLGLLVVGTLDVIW